MEQTYLHRVVGLYPTHAAAQVAMDELLAHGGAGATIALAAANITLFITNPVFGALYLLGWGASLGGLLGAVVGAERHKGDVASLIKDAMACSQFVLVVHAMTEAQTSQSQRIFGKFMASDEGELALED